VTSEGAVKQYCRLS